MSRKLRYGLSAAVLALIAAGASAPEILDQFLDEKEGNHTTAYRDGAGYLDHLPWSHPGGW
ncbi:endolysin [Escherichia coli]|nr:endolysin [Escherichia coli]